MKPNKQKKLKLTLIEMLSNPDNYMEDIQATSETKELPSINGQKQMETSGRKTFTITIFDKRKK